VTKFLTFMTSAKTAKFVETSFTELVKSIISWQLSLSDQPVRLPEMSEVWNYLPTGYLIGMHDDFGPKMMAKLNKENQQQFSNQELSSAIKASTLVDYDKITEVTNIIGSFPWTDPSGVFHYIAFSVAKPGNEANKALYLLGYVSDRGIADVMNSSANIIDGYLHQGMNEITHYLNNLDKKLFSNTNITAELTTEADEIAEIILKLREKIFTSIRSRL
ncbi:MAG: hypothetical protein ACW99Q_19180, partial [Candidatus Kariarchaeaceae archaeon]